MFKKLSPVALSTIPVLLALNVATGLVVGGLKLPVYLDAIGTCLAALLLYPLGLTGLLAAIAVGVGSFVISGALFNPVLFWFIGTQVVIAIYSYAVFARHLHAQVNPSLRRTIAIATFHGIVLGLICAIVNAPVVALVFGGVTGSGVSLIAAVLLKAGQSLWTATINFGLLTEPLDKGLQCIAAGLVYRSLDRAGIRIEGNR